jgi:succinoglycan biosynthesis protein ExoM
MTRSLLPGITSTTLSAGQRLSLGAQLSDDPAVDRRSGEPSTMTLTQLAVCICTYRRPDDLRRLVTRLVEEANDLREIAKLTVVVVDDDPDASARQVVESMDSEFVAGIRYASTGSGNISTARNHAVATGMPGSDCLAFIDDDCLPDVGWLRHLLAVQQSTGCEVVCGCCYDEAPPGSPKWLLDAPFLAGPRELPNEAVITIGSIKNTLVTTAFLSRSRVQFDTEFGIAGGEDVMWFSAAAMAGATMRYAANGVVREMTPVSRTGFPYLLKRALWFGNTEVVTGLAVGSQPRWRMLVSGVNCLIRAMIRPVGRLATRRTAQWRYAATEALRGVGRVVGACGVRIRHH